MTFKLKYRTPSLDHITVNVDGTDNVLTNEQYIEIIKSASRVSGSGRDYINYRNRLLEEYFITGPKEQFSW